MNKNEMPFKKIATNTVYRGRVINVHIDTVNYEGKDITWEIVEMGNAVVVIPLIDKNKFVILKQFRYTTKKHIWEFPAGRADEGETFENCAQRELEEECGYRAKRLKKLVSYYPSPGVITEKMHLFLAQDLYRSEEAQKDEDEIIEHHIIEADEIERMIHSGEIEDAKTILAFLYYKSYRDNIL